MFSGVEGGVGKKGAVNVGSASEQGMLEDSAYG